MIKLSTLPERRLHNYELDLATHIWRSGFKWYSACTAQVIS
jgi:hypothetical protein